MQLCTKKQVHALEGNSYPGRSFLGILSLALQKSTYFAISYVMSGSKDGRKGLTVHDHTWVQNSKSSQATKLNLPHVCLYMNMDVFAWTICWKFCPFVKSCHGRSLNNFLMLRSSWSWSCEMMYRVLPTFLHYDKAGRVWIKAVLFSKCTAPLSTNKKACQGVVRDL